MQILPDGPPQNGLLEIHARVEQVVLFQDDRKHRQEFRQSSFLFLERTCTGSPLVYKRFPPTGENPKTHGVLASQDSVPQGGSQGRAWKMKNSGIELEVIDLGIMTHVVPGKLIQEKEVRMLRSRNAHAQKKKKSKRKARTTAARAPCKRLTDCANRASLST